MKQPLGLPYTVIKDFTGLMPKVLKKRRKFIKDLKDPKFRKKTKIMGYKEVL